MLQRARPCRLSSLSDCPATCPMLKISRMLRTYERGRFNVFTLPKSTDETYPANRRVSYDLITQALERSVYQKLPDTTLCLGDSLEVLKSIPSNSIDLILTDPPYHSTKKANIYGDSNFGDDTEFLDWLDEYFAEWHRVLRPNGSVYVFASTEMAPFIYVRASRLMNMHNLLTWTKPNEPGYDGWKQKMKKTALRKWYPHSEKIVFCSPAMDGNLKRSSFGAFLKECRKICKLSSNKLTELTGAYGKVNNGGAVSNWETGRNIPSRSQYLKICEAFVGSEKIEIMPGYEDVIRAFQIDPKLPFTDAWDQMNVRQYRGKHPAEKPLDLLELIISTSSYEGDVVLDCFSGSGSTLIAARNLRRRSIGIEIESRWVEYSSASLSAKLPYEASVTQTETMLSNSQESSTEHLPLFQI